MEKVKIVVVDDSPFSIIVITNILIERGFEVVGSARSLEETIDVVKEKSPDLVTMDMTIPGTDGLECTRAIHAINPNIKVIIVSSMMDDEIIKKAKASNASGYIQKPVDADELIITIERLTAGDTLFNELKNDFFDVFKESFADAINRMMKIPIPTYSEIVNINESQASRGISIVVAIIGKYTGRMIIDVSYKTAEAMTSSILNKKVENIDEPLAMIGELTNIIAGNACSMLNRKNKLFGFRVAPPTIFHGTSLTISKALIDITSVIITTVFGEVYLNVGFKSSEEIWM